LEKWTPLLAERNARKGVKSTYSLCGQVGELTGHLPSTILAIINRYIFLIFKIYIKFCKNIKKIL